MEVVGVSTQGWDDAVRLAVDRVATTARHVTGAELIRSAAVVRGGEIDECHADAGITFIYFGGQARGPSWRR